MFHFECCCGLNPSTDRLSFPLKTYTITGNYWVLFTKQHKCMQRTIHQVSVWQCVCGGHKRQNQQCTTPSSPQHSSVTHAVCARATCNWLMKNTEKNHIIMSKVYNLAGLYYCLSRPTWEYGLDKPDLKHGSKCLNVQLFELPMNQESKRILKSKVTHTAWLNHPAGGGFKKLIQYHTGILAQVGTKSILSITCLNSVTLLLLTEISCLWLLVFVTSYKTLENQQIQYLNFPFPFERMRRRQLILSLQGILDNEYSRLDFYARLRGTGTIQRLQNQYFPSKLQISKYHCLYIRIVLIISTLWEQ